MWVFNLILHVIRVCVHLCPCLQMNYISAHNSEMVKHIAEVEGHTALLKGQLQQTELYWNRALADNARLHQQMAVLTARAEVLRLSVLWHHLGFTRTTVCSFACSCRAFTLQ